MLYPKLPTPLVLAASLACVGSPSPSEVETGTDTDQTETETGMMAEPCDHGSAQFQVLVTVPPRDPPLDEEAGIDQRSATCIVDSVTVTDATTVLALTCDEDEGPIGEAYTVEFTAPQGESFALAEAVTVELEYDSWWGFEVGGGMRLRLDLGGETVLLAYVESSLHLDCWLAGDERRMLADAWLDVIGGQLVDGECGEQPDWPDDAMRVTLHADLGAEAPVPWGEVVDLPGAALRFVVQQAECFGGGGFAITWDTSFAAWAPGP